MTDKIMKEVCTKAIETYGVDSQLNVAVEEMSELTKEICKLKRGLGIDYKLAEEIADVEIMVYQLKLILHNDEMVENIKSSKLARLLGRVKIAEGAK